MSNPAAGRRLPKMIEALTENALHHAAHIRLCHALTQIHHPPNTARGQRQEHGAVRSQRPDRGRRCQGEGGIETPTKTFTDGV